MSTSPRHYKDELQDWLDGRLDAETCVEVERHVEMCAECRREYEAMWWTKKFASKHYAPTEAPEALRANVLAAIRSEAFFRGFALVDLKKMTAHHTLDRKCIL